MNILDVYVKTQPSSQNIVDLFKGEWASKFPTESGLISDPGYAGLFEDGRITWAESVLGSFKGKSILELGPLEAGHTYMFQKAGAGSVIAIEANSRAFLKCLCVKEILNLDRVQFLLGDFNAYMESSNTKFDVLISSGVLYHMTDPVHTLKLISERSDKAFLWTHYYDAVIAESDQLKKKFGPVQQDKYNGVAYEYSMQSYLEALDWQGFCGGSAPTSRWLTRESLFGMLKSFGFNKLEVAFDQKNHPNGPSLAICASK